MLAWWLVETGDAAPVTGESGQPEAKTPELPNIFGVVHDALLGNSGTHSAVEGFDNSLAGLGFHDPMVKDPGESAFSAFGNIAFAFIYIALIIGFLLAGYKRIKRSPKEGNLSRRALLLEIIVLFFDDFFSSVLVDKTERRKHLAFVGTLFLYIFVCNTMGLIWLGRAPTANLSFNAGLAVIVFFYVHITAISRSPVGYLKHFPGSLPTIKEMGPMGYAMIPFLAILFIFIHISEVFIQPISLALRLFGNMLGKEVLLGAFAGLITVSMVSIPLHTPFLFLGLLLGTIQALIFSLLTAVYISMWLPHDHAHEHAPEAGHAH